MLYKADTPRLRSTTQNICFLVGQYKTRTADYGLRTGYKTRTRYKTRTADYGLRTTDYGLKYGLRTTHFAHFGLESVMVFEGTTGAYMNGRIYRFILNE